MGSKDCIFLLYWTWNFSEEIEEDTLFGWVGHLYLREDLKRTEFSMNLNSQQICNFYLDTGKKQGYLSS